MKKSVLTLTAVLLAVFLTLGAPGAQAEENVIPIGYSGPLSGGGAQFGINLQMGMDLAADVLNAGGGVDVAGKKYKVKIISMDDQFQVALTVNNAKRMVHKEGATMVYNPNSGAIFGLMAINEKENFIVGAYTTNQVCVTSGNQLIFRGPPPMMAYVKAWADKAWEHGWRKCAMMQDAYEYGKLWSGLFQKYWEQKGGTITANIPVDFMKVTDYYPLLTKALATNPDVILLGSSSEPDAMQIQQARELGFKGGFIIIERGKLDEMERIVDKKSMLDGCIGTAPISMYPMENIKKLEKRFHDKYGKDKVLTHETGIAFGNVLLYVGAMVKAGTTTDVKKIMHSFRNDPTIFDVPFVKDNETYQTRKIYPNGSVKGNVYGVEFKDGKYTPVFPVLIDDATYTDAY